MSKRFTDTEKWSDPWFLSLPLQEQWFWGYVLDRCNHAGIWKIEWNYVITKMGRMPNLVLFGERMFLVSDEKIFIPKFLSFQYGHKWQESRVLAHRSAVHILESLGLLDKAIEITKATTTVRKGYEGLRTLTATATATDTITDTAGGAVLLGLPRRAVSSGAVQHGKHGHGPAANGQGRRRVAGRK